MPDWMERARIEKCLSRIEALAVATAEKALWVNEGADDISPQGAELAYHLFTIAGGMRAIMERE